MASPAHRQADVDTLGLAGVELAASVGNIDVAAHAVRLGSVWAQGRGSGNLADAALADSWVGAVGKWDNATH